MRNQTTMSDGARLLMLIRGGAVWQRISALQAIASASLAGVRPREWNADLIELACGPDDGSADGREGRALRYSWLLDNGRVAEAEEQLVWLLEQRWPGGAAPVLLWEAVSFAAMFGEDARTSRRWFDAVSAAVPRSRDSGYQVAAASLACVEQRWDDARRLIPAARHACAKIADRGTAAAIEDALLALSRRL